VLRIILYILIFVNIIYADRLYYIKFGSFRQWTVLERSINRLPYKMRSHVIVVKSRGWFIPFAYHTTKLQALRVKLPQYKRYFPDAHIASSPYILNHRVVRNYTSNEIQRRKYIRVPEKQYSHNITSMWKLKRNSTITAPPLSRTTYVRKTKPVSLKHDPEIQSYITITKTVIPTPTKNIESGKRVYKNFNKKMLSGRDYYLTYKSKDKDIPNLLVKVSFKNYKVTYQPLVGDMNMREAKYLVDDNKLYMFADTFSKEGAFSKIEGNKKDYILVSSWYNGKKINTLRYYYDLNKAKSYLGEKSLSRLATALEDGDFDRLHQAFIGVDGIYTTDSEDW
jgi:hypothetical protein